MKIETEHHQNTNIGVLNEDSNKLLAKFITIATFSGSVINLVSRTIFTNQNKIEIVILSFFLILLGIASSKLQKSKYSSLVVTHILSIFLAFIVVTLILLFSYNGGVTIWAISLLCLIITVVGISKIAIIYNTIATISVELYLWKLHPYMKADLDPSDYVSRIGIYIIALIMVYVVNNILGERIRKNLQQITDIETKNSEIIALHQEIYKLISESTSDGIWNYDLRNNKQVYSQWWLNILGYSEKELLSMGDWLCLVDADDSPIIQTQYENYLEHKIDYFEHECRMKTKEGNYLWIKIKVKALFDTDGSPYMVLGAYADITPIREKEERLKSLAFYDSLTGMPNRHYFHEKLKSYLEASDEEIDKLYIVFIDLDDFKKVNDSLGHYYGDILLREISSRFNEIVHNPCFLGRLGGDEFAVIIQGVTEACQVESYIQKLMDSLKEPVKLNNNKFIISASFGISVFPDDGTEVDELLRNADTAMYSAKESGKNNFKLFNKSMGTDLMKKIDIENRLLSAIKGNEFYLEYQPQFSLEDNKVRGFEALIRWNNSELGIVPPMDFIPFAEETGYIDAIGKWVLRTACSRFYQLQHEFNYFGIVSVNISTVQFMNPSFLNMISEVLLETNFNPQYLELEVTESVFIDSFENAITVFNKLKKLGIKISLDDFGTGYSSLSYLHQLPIDTLKIDKHFIKALRKNDNKSNIVKPIIELAHNMNIHVVAEGVENEEQLNYLKNAKCDNVQGFLLGRPTTEVEKYL